MKSSSSTIQQYIQRFRYSKPQPKDQRQPLDTPGFWWIHPTDTRIQPSESLDDTKQAERTKETTPINTITLSSREHGEEKDQVDMETKEPTNTDQCEQEIVDTIPLQTLTSTPEREREMKSVEEQDNLIDLDEIVLGMYDQESMDDVSLLQVDGELVLSDEELLLDDSADTWIEKLKRKYSPELLKDRVEDVSVSLGEDEEYYESSDDIVDRLRRRYGLAPTSPGRKNSLEDYDSLDPSASTLIEGYGASDLELLNVCEVQEQETVSGENKVNKKQIDAFKLLKQGDSKAMEDEIVSKMRTLDGKKLDVPASEKDAAKNEDRPEIRPPSLASGASLSIPLGKAKKPTIKILPITSTVEKVSAATQSDEFSSNSVSSKCSQTCPVDSGPSSLPLAQERTAAAHSPGKAHPKHKHIDKVDEAFISAYIKGIVSSFLEGNLPSVPSCIVQLKQEESRDRTMAVVINDNSGESPKLEDDTELHLDDRESEEKEKQEIIKTREAVASIEVLEEESQELQVAGEKCEQMLDDHIDDEDDVSAKVEAVVDGVLIAVVDGLIHDSLVEKKQEHGKEELEYHDLLQMYRKDPIVQVLLDRITQLEKMI